MAACSVQRIKELMGNLWGSFMAAFVEVIHGYYNMTFAAKMLVGFCHDLERMCENAKRFYFACPTRPSA